MLIWILFRFLFDIVLIFNVDFERKIAKMTDSFLEREKELMKLNDSLNNRMSFDLKTPKSLNTKPANKMKRFSGTKPFKLDVNQAKNGTKDANKLKSDSCDVKKPFATTYSTERLCEKHELDLKDNASNRSNDTIDDANKRCNEIKHMANDQINNNICDTLVESIEKAIDTKPTTNANQLNLIPANVFRKNASAEGIIK